MAPAASNRPDEISESNKESFELLVETKVDGNISLSKYRSKRTGITYFIADVKGPIVKGHLCLATEAFDDDGLPHTLEHLIFMGSESYPYKGVLDLLANRCLASGSNASTDTDHTFYTMTTAGSEGFLNLLPIYLDHILYPTLTDSAFKTEVHHINGEGEDSGIVYCEMQGRENSGESRCFLAIRRAMYPGHCGYRSETGGMLKNLRESTSNEKVRDYHKAFYRPENLCVIITGQVEAADVFRAVEPIEEKILLKGHRTDFVRPWQSFVPPLEASLDQIIPYPCDDDEHGMVYAAWRGPAITNFEHLLAVTLLMEYLTDTSVAPLQKEFVEIDDPFCGDVSGVVIEGSVSCLMLEFESVPKEKLYLIKEKLLKVLRKLVKTEDSIDMKRFTTVVYRRKLHILNGMENSAHNMIATEVIGDFLYGNSNEDLFLRMQKIPILDKLMEQKAKFWSNIIRKYLVDAFLVVTIGESSPSLLAEMTEIEKQRIASAREGLGEEGLKKKEEELKKAIEENEVEAPNSLLTSVDVPGIKSIHFHSIKRSCSYRSQADVVDGFPLENLPCHFQLDDIQSVFVQLEALLDTSCLSAELRLYLPLWIELILESPLLRNGKIIPYEEVVAELSEDTVCSGAGLGIGGGGGRFTCGPHAQMAAIVIKVEPGKYQKGVNWLKEILQDNQFVADRIAVVAKKMIKEVASVKRDGYAIASTLMHNMGFCPKSNNWSSSPIRQLQFLSKVLQTLETNPQEVVDKLEELRRCLKELTIHMSGDVKSLCQQGEPCAPWTKAFYKSGNILQPKSEPEPCYQLVQPLDCGLPTGTIAGIGAVESSYLVQTAPIAISYTHPDLPALLVLIQYLTQVEGPMWRQIRGQGLSYHYSIFPRLPEKLIYFVLYKSTHIIRAYKEAKTIVENHMASGAEWDDSLLEASRSSLMFEIIEKEKSVADIALQSTLAYFRNLDIDYNRKLLDLVSQVQLDDIKRVGPLYLMPLFDASQTRCSICCHPSKVEEVVSGFKEMSRSLTVINSLEDSFLANFI